jgi:1-acyl-sn-glycerol-3-phosphate acyltransferase
MRTLISIGSFLWKVYIGIVFIFFAVLLYPFFLVLLWNRKWRKFSFKLFVFWSWMMRIFCFYIVSRKKNSLLPEPPYIIVANHTSYLDIFFMYSLFPKNPFVFLGKSEILSYPIIRTYFQDLNVPVFRDNKRKSARSYMEALKKVEEGYSLVIFPEGGIPDNEIPRMRHFKEGAFKLAKSCKIPVIPVTFTNNFKLFSDPTHHHGTARPGVSKVHIHSYIPKEQVIDMPLSDLASLCFYTINQPLLEEYPRLRDNKAQ